MKKWIIFIFMASIFNLSHADTLIEFYIQWDEVLVDYGSKKGFDYDRLHKENEKLKKIAWSMGHANLRGRREDELKSFYIDAFNFIVVKQIINAYPVKSVQEIPGLMTFHKYDVAGEQLSLQDILDKKIKPFNDARMLLALNYGSVGSPSLYAHAMIPFLIDLQLDLQCRIAMNAKHFIRVKPKSELLVLPEYLLWYRDEFETKEMSLRQYVNSQLREGKECPNDYELEFYPYSWKLNSTSE